MTKVSFEYKQFDREPRKTSLHYSKETDKLDTI